MNAKVVKNKKNAQNQKPEKISESDKTSDNSGKLFKTEDRAIGSISFSVYHKIIKGMGGYILFIIICGLVIAQKYYAFEFSRARISWAENYYIKKNTKDNTYLWKTLKFMTLTMTFTFLQAYLLSLFLTLFMRKLHSKMLFRLLHGRVAEYFQRTPIGIIINRFSNDINLMDLSFVGVMGSIIAGFFGMVPDIYAIYGAITKWYALIPGLLFIILGTLLRNLYLKP